MSKKFSNQELQKMREEFEHSADDMTSNELVDAYVELEMQTLKDDERDYYIECGWISDDTDDEQASEQKG
tara:strand:- start:323 stop:532 length:210 start_codon:yes stop_codon:yes gene_type:complete